MSSVVPDTFPRHWAEPTTADQWARLAEDAARSRCYRAAAEALRAMLDATHPCGHPDYATRIRGARLVDHLGLADFVRGC